MLQLQETYEQEAVRTGVNRVTVWRRRNPEKARAAGRREMLKARADGYSVCKARNLAIRKEVIDHYGGKCCCCGEAVLEFLTLDHIDGGGTKHRNERNPAHFYRRLKREGYPTGLRVMCWNCNCGRRMNGGVCPHRRKRGTQP